jgi:hypothetical protein
MGATRAASALAQLWRSSRTIWHSAFETMQAHHFPPKPVWAEFGRKLGILYDDYTKEVSGSACAINKMENDIVLHTQEVTGSSPVAPTIESRTYGPTTTKN